MHLGSDFCDRNGMIFTEVMALRGPSELPAYAAGKDLVPTTLDICPEVASGARRTEARTCQASLTTPAVRAGPPRP